VDPNLETACDFIEAHLGRSRWFAGADITIADFQMSYPIEALLARSADAKRYPRIASTATGFVPARPISAPRRKAVRPSRRSETDCAWFGAGIRDSRTPATCTD